VARIGGTHHVLGIKLLLGELRHSESTVLLRSTGSERCKTDHKKVETREWDHVHGKLAKIAVKLTRETKRASSSANGSRDEVVKIAVCWSGQLKGSEADIVQGLVIKGKALVGVLDKLVHGEGAVVRLNDGIRYLRRRDNRVCRHDTIRILLADLGDKQSAETRARTTTH
jgi:hypothetical protein